MGFEYSSHVLAMFEPRFFGNINQRKLRAYKQFSGPSDPGSDDRVVNRFMENATESALKHAHRQASVSRDIAYVDFSAYIVSDKE